MGQGNELAGRRDLQCPDADQGGLLRDLERAGDGRGEGLGGCRAG